MLVRKHADLGMACLAQSVNVVGLLKTNSETIELRSDLTGLDDAKWPAETSHLLSVSVKPVPCADVSLQLFSKYMKNGHLIHLPSLPDA